MQTKYQVFVSSTYNDLKEERKIVIQTLMKLNCIPAGMELFPAVDEEQWNFIKKVIDDCDYYLIIIGGRYGSLTSEGISYTEKEFDYAVEKGIKVIALIHKFPENIAVGKSEIDLKLREQLSNFKTKVEKNRLVEYWEEAKDLAGQVALSMLNTMNTYPATGWIRANQVSNESILLELNDLRKENQNLQKTVTELSAQNRPNLENIAEIDSNSTINCYHYPHDRYNKNHVPITISWREIFSLIAPYLIECPTESSVEGILENIFKNKRNYNGNFEMENQDLKTIAIQLSVYGLIRTQYSEARNGSMYIFWSLTQKGEQLMIETRAIRKNVENNQSGRL